MKIIDKHSKKSYYKDEITKKVNELEDGANKLGFDTKAVREILRRNAKGLVGQGIARALDCVDKNRYSGKKELW